MYPAWRIAVLGLMALLMLLPVTLPVPVLRELVAERFGVSELLTSLFMSINMVGAVLAAPLAGALADRFGQRPRLIAARARARRALLPRPDARRSRSRCSSRSASSRAAAHIFALSLLLGLASGARPEAQRGLAMGATGSGLLLGVAIGAPLGGRLGRRDPLVPLYVGAAVVALAAVLALLLLRETAGRERERPGLGEIARLVRASPIVAIPLAVRLRRPLHGGLLHLHLPADAARPPRAAAGADRPADRRVHAALRRALVPVRASSPRDVARVRAVRRQLRLRLPGREPRLLARPARCSA